MKEQRLYKRFSAKLPVRLDAITTRQLKVFYLITKDISATGAFVYTKEIPWIQDKDTVTVLILAHNSSCGAI